MRASSIAVCALALLAFAAGSNAQRYATVAEYVAAQPDLTLIGQAAGLVGFGPQLVDPNLNVTLFLPTDTALLKALNATGLSIVDFLNQTDLVRAIISYHIVPKILPASRIPAFGVEATLLGAGVTIQKNHRGVRLTGQTLRNRAWVVRANGRGAHSVIHVIDNVLLPPYPNFVAAAGAAQLNLLATAVVAADLAPTLSDPTLAWTLFAPLDSAISELIQELFAGNATALLTNKPLLTSVLTYHAVSAAPLLAEQAPVGRTPLPTVNGASITVIKTKTGKIAVRGGSADNVANVVVANIRAGAGVIHIIDKVLLPPA